MKNKKIIILVGAGVLVLLFAASLIIRQNRQNNIVETQVTQPVENFQADFLSPAEKQNLNITTDLKVQALKRNAQGEVMVYKIIRNDKDIINPEKVKPISPRSR